MTLLQIIGGNPASVRHTAVAATLAFGVSIACVAQMPLATAVMLARDNSPRVKLAEDDLRRARFVVSETKDAFIPSVIVNGGAGDSYGITLSVPTILTVNAQSLVYSSAQRFYLRASRMSVQAAMLALDDARQRVEEDAVLTYLNLDNIQQTATALADESDDLAQLETIVRKRLDAGLENPLALNQTHRQVLSIRLQQLQLEDERAILQEHLSGLIRRPGSSIVTVHDSIPSSDAMLLPAANDMVFTATASELAADANAKARQLHADGDARYRWRPQIGFAAQYGRVSPINDVSDYYNLHGQYNVAFFGVQIQLPVFDAAHRARADEAATDAIHAQHDVELIRTQQAEDRLRLMHAFSELVLRTQIAELDASIAMDQLKAITLQASRGGDGGPVLNPKDEQDARVRVRQRSLDLLDAQLQLRRTQVSLLRMTGGLDTWLGLPTPLPVRSTKP